MFSYLNSTDMQLIWASKVSCVPVALRVAKFGGLAGLIVTLDETGTVEVSCIMDIYNFHFYTYFEIPYIWALTHHTV